MANPAATSDAAAASAERLAWFASGRSGKVGVSLALAPGDYTIEATCEDLRASGTIAVAPGRAAMTLELRKP